MSYAYFIHSCPSEREFAIIHRAFRRFAASGAYYHKIFIRIQTTTPVLSVRFRLKLLLGKWEAQEKNPLSTEMHKKCVEQNEFDTLMLYIVLPKDGRIVSQTKGQVESTITVVCDRLIRDNSNCYYYNSIITDKRNNWKLQNLVLDNS